MTGFPAPREYHLQLDSATGTAVDHLAAASGLSRQRIKQAMQKGAVWLERGGHTRRLRRASRTLQPGDRLHLYYDARILAMQPPAARLVHDAGVYSVWIKPAGMYSQGSKWGDHCAIDRRVARQLEPERPAFIVHRLDRAASGLILIAHQKRSAAALAALFANRRIDKRYQVIVHGRFPDTPQPLDFDAPLDGKPAASHVTRLAWAADRDRSLLEVRIDTGRKHQIRRHLAAAGFPVVGDRLYGKTADPDALQLVACYLAFTSPFDDTPCEYTLPADLLPALEPA